MVVADIITSQPNQLFIYSPVNSVVQRVKRSFERDRTLQKELRIIERRAHKSQINQCVLIISGIGFLSMTIRSFSFPFDNMIYKYQTMGIASSDQP